MSAERDFRESLRAFNASTTTGRGASGGWGGLGGSNGGDESTQSLLGSFRTRTQNAFAGLGFGQQEEELFGLTRWQRMVGFVAFLGMSIFCFMIAFFTIPMLALNPAKFATTYTLGSILALVSMSLLQGPRAFLRHIFSRERLPFTLMYLASMIVTLYFAVVKHAYIMTVVFSLIQIICLLYYFGSYIPGGTSGLGFITKYFARNTVGLPV